LSTSAPTATGGPKEWFIAAQRRQALKPSAVHTVDCTSGRKGKKHPAVNAEMP